MKLFATMNWGISGYNETHAFWGLLSKMGEILRVLNPD